MASYLKYLIMPFCIHFDYVIQFDKYMTSCKRDVTSLKTNACKRDVTSLKTNEVPNKPIKEMVIRHGFSSYTYLNYWCQLINLLLYGMHLSCSRITFDISSFIWHVHACSDHPLAAVTTSVWPGSPRAWRDFKVHDKNKTFWWPHLILQPVYGMSGSSTNQVSLG